jgi:hypothetical protein
VSNILKYYIVYRRLAELNDERAKARDIGLESMAIAIPPSPRQQTTTDRQ